MWAFVSLFALILIHGIRDVNPVPSASTSPLWRGSYTQSSYWYSDYAIDKPQPKKQYLPSPQFCPQFGRTICTEVKPSYPSDDVFEVIKAAKAKRFNISSEFVDESLNDEEPHFYEEQPEYNKPPKHEGYVVYQTAVHYDNNYQKPNYNNRQNNNNYNHHSSYPPNDSPYNYGFGNNYNSDDNRGQYRPYDTKQKPFEQTIYPYNSHYTPMRYPNDNHNNYYPQHQQSPHGYQQPFDNEMISQRHQNRYKRQTDPVVDPVCQSRMILVEPKAALNDKSQWKFVVNLSDRDPRLKQAIKVEVCQTPGQSCSNHISLPFGFVSRCKQKYIKKKLLSLDSSGQSISSENFFAPSCCVCEIQRNNKR
ncbi:protein spaetzle 5-like [Oppia nitens]|uniref:protein spaetzle 5-like n=1 Tax=Oppia nitens TaxID=1686743 RepID=UPI0023DB05DD|nr:protein spaetzle 5-like [Oppia nitens]